MREKELGFVPMWPQIAKLAQRVEELEKQHAKG